MQKIDNSPIICVNIRIKMFCYDYDIIYKKKKNQCLHLPILRKFVSSVINFSRDIPLLQLIFFQKSITYNTKLLIKIYEVIFNFETIRILIQSMSKFHLYLVDPCSLRIDDTKREKVTVCLCIANISREVSFQINIGVLGWHTNY